MASPDPQRLNEQLEGLAAELAALSEADLPSRLHDLEDRLEQRINLLRQLGDEWAALLAPVSRSGGLRGLNALVEDLGQRVQRLTTMLIVLSVTTVLLAVVVLVG